VDVVVARKRAPSRHGDGPYKPGFKERDICSAAWYKVAESVARLASRFESAEYDYRPDQTTVSAEYNAKDRLGYGGFYTLEGEARRVKEYVEWAKAHCELDNGCVEDAIEEYEKWVRESGKHGADSATAMEAIAGFDSFMSECMFSAVDDELGVALRNKLGYRG
jgi:hypothetical protein